MANNDDIAKQLQALLKQRDLLTEINDSLKTEAQLREKLTTSVLAEQKALEKIGELESEAQAGLRDEVSFLEKRRIKQEESVALAKEDLDNLKEQIQIRETLFKLAESGNKKEQEKAKLIIEARKLSKEELERQKQYFKKEKELFTLKMQALKASRDSEESVKTLGSYLGIADDISKTWLGKLENALQSTESIGGALEGVSKGIRETFTPTKIFQSTVDKVVESTVAMTYEMDNTLSSFNKATGAGGKFNEQIDQVRMGSMAAGVGLKESAESFQSLYENMSSFTQLNVETQNQLARTTAELDSMGIASKTTAQALDIGTKALGMNVMEALDAQKQIAAEATQLGISPGKLADDFVGSLPKLAQYGKQSVQIFKNLAAQSKATGISIEGLIGISQQFDTFEGAAQSAGKLNAILGGNLLNSVELLSANESERIDMLRQSVQLSGRNFNELSKFDKMAIASAAGIKDLNEASRLFGTSSEEFEKVKKAQDAEALSTQKLTEYAQSATSAQKKFQLVIESFSGAALPLLNIISGLLNQFLALNDLLGGLLVPLFVAVVGGIYLISKAMQAWNIITSVASGIQTAYIAVVGTSTVANEANAASEAEVVVAKNSGILASIKKAAVTAYETLATKALEAAALAFIAAEWLVNTVRNANILSTIKNISLTVAEQVATAAITGALLVYEGVQWLVNVVKNANIFSTIANIALIVAEEIAVWGVTAALFAYEAVQAIATGAMWLFNIALSANPIGLVIIAIVALIAGLAALIIYFDDISGWINDVTGGFFDLWDVILIGIPFIGWGIEIWRKWDKIVEFFGSTMDNVGNSFMDIYDIILTLMGPVGWFIEIGKKVYENWESVINGIKSLFTSLVDTVTSVFSKITNTIKNPLNIGIETVNSIISKANVVPGVNIPEIPQLADGATNFSGGMAMVGEEGPEIVNLPNNSNVITNENSKNLTSAANSLQKAKTEQANTQSNNFEKSSFSKEKSNSTAASDSGDRVLILQLNDRELGRAVINIFNKNTKLNLSGI